MKLRTRSLKAAMIASLATLLTLAVPALAAETTAPDTGIESLLQHRLQKNDLASKISVDVSNGVVTLEGTVDTLAERMEAERLALKFDEVESVTNRITLEEVDKTPQEIAVDVKRVLDGYQLYDVFDWVEARVEPNGVVTLDGKVYQAWRQDVMEKRVARIEGVKGVVNSIEVLPVSGHDDQLRFQAARAIYTNIHFSDWAGFTQKPIHILVDRGDVTLEGVVRSKVEKVLAESLVRQNTLAFQVDNNLQVVSEMPR